MPPEPAILDHLRRERRAVARRPVVGHERRVRDAGRDGEGPPRGVARGREEADDGAGGGGDAGGDLAAGGVRFEALVLLLLPDVDAAGAVVEGGVVGLGRVAGAEGVGGEVGEGGGEGGRGGEAEAEGG